MMLYVNLDGQWSFVCAIPKNAVHIFLENVSVICRMAKVKPEQLRLANDKRH